ICRIADTQEQDKNAGYRSQGSRHRRPLVIEIKHIACEVERKRSFLTALNRQFCCQKQQPCSGGDANSQRMQTRVTTEGRQLNGDQAASTQQQRTKRGGREPY